MLTTVTTVGGLVPLAFFATGQARFLSPMAIAVVWGLSFATILTLMLTPCLYAILDDAKAIARRLFRVGAATPLEAFSENPLGGPPTPAPSGRGPG